MKFDLVGEPWIPVQAADGPTEVSLFQLFERPQEFRDLAVSFGPERMALTRILAAVVMSAAASPVDDKAKLAWLKEPGNHASRVRGYLERWRERFDLFHSERPFMQQPVDPEHSRDLSISVLAIDWASGNNVTLFDHHVDDRPPAVSPARAARMLLTTLLYQPGGGVSYPFNRTDSPGTKPVMAIALGRDLWQTLVGACPSATRGVRTDKPDRPAWERALDGDEPTKEGRPPHGAVDRLTWRSRAIQLLPDSEGIVRHVRLHQHLKLSNDVPPDPYVPVRQRKGEEPKALRVRPGRRLWREADGIFYGIAETDKHPTAVREAVSLFRELEPALRPKLLCVGLEVSQGKIGDCREALLPVSDELLGHDVRLDLIAYALECADGGAAAIAAAVKALNEEAGSERAKERVSRWQEPYWGRLREPFVALLDEVVSAAEAPTSESGTWARWIDEVRGAAWEVMDLLWSAKGGGDDRAFTSLAQARGALQAVLNAKVPKVEVESEDTVSSDEREVVDVGG